MGVGSTVRHFKSIGEEVHVTLDREHAAAETERYQPLQLLLTGAAGTHLDTLEHSRCRLFGSDDPESAIFGQTQHRIGVVAHQQKGSRVDLARPHLGRVHSDQQNRKRRLNKGIRDGTG